MAVNSGVSGLGGVVEEVGVFSADEGAEEAVLLGSGWEEVVWAVGAEEEGRDVGCGGGVRARVG